VNGVFGAQRPALIKRCAHENTGIVVERQRRFNKRKVRCGEQFVDAFFLKGGKSLWRCGVGSGDDLDDGEGRSDKTLRARALSDRAKLR